MNSPKSTDAATFLNEQEEPGQAIFAKWSSNDIDYETVFFVFENRKHLNKLPKYPKIDLRVGLIIYDDIQVALIPIMWRINYKYELLYETMLNVHQAGENGFQYLNDFCSQERIVFHFYEGSDRRWSVVALNSMQSEFQKIKAEVEKLPVWSMADFDKAKERIFKDFSSPTVLFNALESDKNFYLFN